MKTTKEMPTKGRFVAVWEYPTGAMGCYRLRADGCKLLTINDHSGGWVLIDKDRIPSNAIFITSLSKQDEQDQPQLPRLELDDKWKWLAKDVDGPWWFYGNKPLFKTNTREWSTNGGGAVACTKIFKNLPDCTPENSLHEILPGGYIKPYVEPFTPVVGEFYEFCDDPDFPREDCVYGWLEYIDVEEEGTTYTPKGFDIGFYRCRKPQHIKLQEDLNR